MNGINIPYVYNSVSHSFVLSALHLAPYLHAAIIDSESLKLGQINDK